MHQNEDLATRLRRIRNDAARIDIILSSEQHYRRSVVDTAPQVLALDFDVIYDYLFLGYSEIVNREHALDASRCVAAILEHDTCKFTLLPPSVTEMLDVLPRMLELLPRFHFSSATVSNKHEDSQETYDHLIQGWSHAAARTFVSRRATRFLQSTRYVDAADLFHAPDLIDRDHDSVGKYADHLNRIHPRHRSVSALIDAMNLSIVERAVTARLPLTFVTQTSSIRAAFDLLTQESFGVSLSTAAVLSPRLALFRLALARASLSEIEDISTELSAVQETIAAYDAALANGVAGAEGVIDPSRLDIAEERLAGLLTSLTNLHVAVDKAWLPPQETIPENIDLGRLSKLARDAIDEARKEIERFVAAADAVAKRAAALQQQLLPDFHSQRPLLPPSGAQLAGNIYLINAAGTSSAQRLHDQPSGYNTRNVFEALGMLMAAIDQSPLDDSVRRQLLERVSTVAIDIKQSGKLLTHGKRAWAAVKELIGSIPSAVAAWEAVAKLLK